MNGRLLDHEVVPGSPEWLSRMSASKIAVVVGLSPYESPFSLWHKMAGNVTTEDDRPELRRGHYLEPAICAWFADQHPEFELEATGTWVHKERDWQAASPDRLLLKEVPRPGYARNRQATALLECKSASDDSEWGQPGTDEIPVGYRAQVMWQLDTLGLEVCYVAVLSAFLEFREYVVHYDAGEAAYLRDAGRAFLDSVATGQAPPLDGSTATYQAVRDLHPDIDDLKVEIPADLAAEYCRSRAALVEAEAAELKARSEVANYLGAAKTATWNGRTIAYRTSRKGGTPYLQAGRNLPTIDQKDTAA